MTYLALTNIRDGQVVEWLEHVTDEEYNALMTAGRERSRRGRERAPGRLGSRCVLK